MTSTRRQFLRTTAGGSTGLLLQPMLQRFRLEAAGIERTKMPHRFVFVMKSSGIIPERLEPATLKNTIGDRSGPVNESLVNHELPATLKPLEPFKDQVAIIQGLSGKMCRPGHSSWFGAMGVYKTGGEHNSGVLLRATADAELARLFPSPFQHVGLALRGKVMSKEIEGTLYPGITAVGPGRELPFQASPDVAYQQLFGSALSADEKSQLQYDLKSNLLDFMVRDIGKLNQALPSSEREKMGHYLNAFEELQLRRQRLASMSDQIRDSAPEFSQRFSAKQNTMRQQAHVDLTAAALISGITNVVTLRLDNISTSYAQLGLSEKTVHGIGHKEPCNGKSPEEARDIIRLHHMKLLADLAAQLKTVPEGDGSLLDNTSIIYLSDSGNEHHGNLNEWPFVVIGGNGGRLNIAGRYLQYPSYGNDGHRTIGNWWTTWLNAFGNPIEHYGNLDLAMQKNGMPQTGPLSELMIGVS
ncbi:DUF1552 domain-containing protein [bacterium]|nr:DUF1552 domain-containing protein [bacterium]MDB4561653.1 DUF1552 domain-containing protein [bacterium]MDC0307172.1 DUF1552 domain-containing protein [bacterium]